MFEEQRNLFLTFHIDTNRINSRGALENMNKLEHWAERGIILLYMSKIAHEEAMAGRDQRRARRAFQSIYSYTMATTAGEMMRLAAIETVLFPSGARTQNERNDVEIAFNAGKYGAILVTADRDLLDHRSELRGLGVKVFTDGEAVELVERKIIARDERARRISDMTAKPCPDWVGND